MYGLFYYVYDYYEFEDVVVISKSKNKLRKYFSDNEKKVPITESDDEHELYARKEEVHYMIRKMEVI